MVTKILNIVLLFCAFLTPLGGISGCTEKEIKEDEPSKYRILGYLYVGDNLEDSFRQVDLSRLTDLNIAFVNPDRQGNFQSNPFYTALVKKAHEHQVQVFFSIGGGSPPDHLGDVLSTADGRDKLVNGIVDFLDKYGFDGVDIDLENDLINTHYAPFVYQTAKAVKAKGKMVTAALAKWNSNLIADSTLARYDFINIMSYDATGPWNLDNAGPHSLYTMAVSDFEYYRDTRRIDADKLMIGVPFYGYGFNGAPSAMFYKDIVASYPGSEDKDEINVSGGTVYYNGIPTIRRKSKFAKEKGARGVMIWELTQDSDDEKSLLKAIHEVLNEE